MQQWLLSEDWAQCAAGPDNLANLAVQRQLLELQRDALQVHPHTVYLCVSK